MNTRFSMVVLGLLMAIIQPLMTQAAPARAENKLLDNVASAQKHLAATERRIAGERQKLASQLNGLEREVLALREQTAVARRLADEKTLSLTQLEKRLESWQQQQVYQRNLLHRFLQQHSVAQSHTAPTSTAPTSIVEQITAVVKAGERLEQRFAPTWQQHEMVLASGEIAQASTLSIGPVTWYWDAQAEQVGLARTHDSGTLQSDALLTGSDSKVIAALRSQPSGEIVFDPTLSRAVARQQHAESLFEHVAKGGLWAIPILLFALFALTIALLKVAQLWRLPKLIRFTPGALQGVLTDAASPLRASVKGMQKVLLDMSVQAESPRQRDDQLFMQLQEDKHILERWIGAIAITAAVSPLLGLLGTVSGMIETFKMMTLFGSGDPEVVSGGIAQALVTTELGLVVAIPALILNAILSRKAKSYYNELESFAILISKSDEIEASVESEANQKVAQKDSLRKSVVPDTARHAAAIAEGASA